MGVHHVHLYSFDYEFRKSAGGVDVRMQGLGYSREGIRLEDTQQALLFCCGHGLSLADLNAVNRMLTGHDVDVKAWGLE